MKSLLSIVVVAALSVAANSAQAQTALTPNGTFPIKIVSGVPGGVYYLTADALVQSTSTWKAGYISNKPVIEVNASNVTLDLRGFSVGSQLVSCAEGAPPVNCTVSNSNAPTVGIKVTGENVRIINGMIRGINGDGVSAAQRAVLEDLSIDSVAGNGLLASHYFRGSNITVRKAVETGVYFGSTGVAKNIVVQQAGYGVRVVMSVLNNVSVRDTSHEGIYMTGGALDGCSVEQAAWVSGSGVGAVSGGVVRNCMVGLTNEGSGYSLQDGSTLFDSSASNNEGYGVSADATSSYSGVNSSNNNNSTSATTQNNGGVMGLGNVCQGVLNCGNSNTTSALD